MSKSAGLFWTGLKHLANSDLGLCSDVECGFVFTPPGRPQRPRGRGNPSRYVQPLLTRAVHDEIIDQDVYGTNVAGTIVAEITIALRALASGRMYSMRYVVVRSAIGRIVLARHSWNPPAVSNRADTTEAA